MFEKISPYVKFYKPNTSKKEIIMSESIQLVLSSYESKYSDLSVFLDKDESEFYVYLGVALLERISTNANEIGYKMFIGRLYNSGVKLSVLTKRFPHDNRTIKKWGNALKTCDVDEMTKAFTGRKAAKKTTPEVIRYIHQQYKNRTHLGRDYRRKIIMGVEEIFAIRLSPSLISQIFCSAKDISDDDSKTLNVENKAIPEPKPKDTDLKNDGNIQRSPVFFLMESHLI